LSHKGTKKEREGESLGHEDTKTRKAKVEYKETSEKEELVAAKIVDAAYSVHQALGPGLLEKVYETCFCHELTKRGLSCERQIEVPIKYDGITFDEGLRLDVVVEGLVICELKAADQTNPVWQAQLLSYLKLTGKRIGFLINFNVPLAKNGIKRIIL
jgi:GxxExxY protein